VPKILIAILLLLSLSYQLFVKLGVVVWYEYNKDYIAKNLCENRDKPEKKCCGKCYLRKQLKKADDGNTTPTGKTVPSKWNMGEVVVFLIPEQINIPVFHKTGQLRKLPINEQYITYNPLNEVFHPPLYC
jgi:hypothetical protein